MTVSWWLLGVALAFAGPLAVRYYVARSVIRARDRAKRIIESIESKEDG